jgi:hypothetical protein
MQPCWLIKRSAHCHCNALNTEISGGCTTSAGLPWEILFVTFQHFQERSPQYFPGFIEYRPPRRGLALKPLEEDDLESRVREN